MVLSSFFWHDNSHNQRVKMIQRLTILLFTVTMAACASSGPEAASTGQAEATQVDVAAGSDNEFEFEDSPQAEQVAAANVGPEDELVCRYEKPAGSNLRRKVCYRRSALEVRAEMDQDTMRQMRSRPQLPSSNN